MITLFLKVFLFLPIFLQGQSLEQPHISGEIKNIKSGFIELVLNNTKAFYTHSFYKNQSSEILEGKFKFVNLNLSEEPAAYRLIIRSDIFIKETDILLLDRNTKTIIIDTVDEHISPATINIFGKKEMQLEYRKLFSEIVTSIRKLDDEEIRIEVKYDNAIPIDASTILRRKRDVLSQSSDSTFLIYAMQNKNSYFSLWKLIERFQRKGFDPNYEKILDSLSPVIRDSYAAKTLKSELSKVNLIELKSQLAKLKLRTALNGKKEFVKNEFGKKYTFIDFWFAKCTPCLKEFPSYINIYKQYKSAGLEIIGISVDQTQNIQHWIETVQERNLVWPNFLDENEIVAKSLAITFYPYNFLLDEKGDIIRKNMSPLELKDFLFNNLEFKNADDNHPKIEPD